MTSCWNSKKCFRPPSFLKSRKLFSIASCRKWIANFLYQLETFLQFHMAAATDLYDPHPHILVVIWNAFWFLVGCISSPLNHFFVVNCWEHGHISLVLELLLLTLTSPLLNFTCFTGLRETLAIDPYCSKFKFKKRSRWQWQQHHGSLFNSCSYGNWLDSSIFFSLYVTKYLYHKSMVEIFFGVNTEKMIRNLVMPS